MGLDPSLVKGLALAGRCIGLLGHINEERHSPTAWKVTRAVEIAAESKGAR